MMKRMIGILLAAVILLSVMACAGAESVISVNGTGNVYMPADTACVTLGVQKYDTDVKAAQNAVNETITAVLKALLDMGIREEDISTDNINLYTYTEYTEAGNELTRYHAMSTLSIRTTDLDAAGPIIDTAFAAGANTLEGVMFSASDTSAQEKEALEAAVADAREKAEILAAASGMKITGVVSISENYTNSFDSGSNSIFTAAKRAEVPAADEEAAGTMVQAARLCISAQIVVCFNAE